MPFHTVEYISTITFNICTPLLLRHSWSKTIHYNCTKVYSFIWSFEILQDSSEIFDLNKDLLLHVNHYITLENVHTKRFLNGNKLSDKIETKQLLFVKNWKSSENCPVGPCGPIWMRIGPLFLYSSGFNPVSNFLQNSKVDVQLNITTSKILISGKNHKKLLRLLNPKKKCVI